MEAPWSKSCPSPKPDGHGTRVRTEVTAVRATAAWSPRSASSSVGSFSSIAVLSRVATALSPSKDSTGTLSEAATSGFSALGAVDFVWSPIGAELAAEAYPAGNPADSMSLSSERHVRFNIFDVQVCNVMLRKLPKLFSLQFIEFVRISCVGRPAFPTSFGARSGPPSRTMVRNSFISSCMTRPSISFVSLPKGLANCVAIRVNMDSTKTWMNEKRAAHMACVAHWLVTIGATSQCSTMRPSQVWP
mmetsp:Transcript_97749/g.281263  ORF Transcript_97749/g.281263 Transcript_97749/m.281263 type:complete len:246 (+) Transcript_97749:236-973(+)